MKKLVNYISASQISQFLFCPLAYKYSYIDGVQQDPPGIYMIYGTAIHEALAHNFRQKIKSREDLSWEEVFKKYLDVFETESSKINFSDGVLKRSFQLSAERTLDYYLGNVAPTLQPKCVEQKFELKLKHFPITIMGFIDLITEDGLIIDYKTVGKDWKRKYTLYELDKNFQATMYASAFRKMFKSKEKAIRFDILPRYEAEAHLKVTTRTEEQVLNFLKFATDIEKIIELGVFMPNLASCSRCQFKDTCNKRAFIEQS